jgi:uncharacterized caspase-like protein
VNEKTSVRISTRLFLAVVFLLFVTSKAFAEGAWSTGEKYALIVGINDYQNEQVVDLQYAVSDAELFRRALMDQGGFEEDNIFVLSSANQEESLRPSLTNIVFRLEWFRDIVKPGDTIVFYFAGHGVSLDEETFLLTEEADERSKGTLMISSLRGRILYDLLDLAGAQDTLVLLDACRNDPTAGRGDSPNTLTESLARGLTFVSKRPEIEGLEKNTATIFACSNGERSWEWAEKGHGFFTYYLVEALKGGAFSSEGEATLSSLASFVRQNVKDSANRWLNNKQTPMMRYEGPDPDSWILARNAGGAPLASSDPEVLRSARERVALIARAEAAEQETRKAQAELRNLQALQDIEATEKDVLAKENALLKARQNGGDVELAEMELELAMDNLKLATEGSKATKDRLTATQRSYAEAVVMVETSQVAKEVSNLTFGQATPTPEVLELQDRLSNLEARLSKLDEEKKLAVERALMAEKRVAKLQAELDAKWTGRALGKRPTRRTRREDLWRVVDPGAEEADSL